jgi:hypothetical protein
MSKPLQKAPTAYHLFCRYESIMSKLYGSDLELSDNLSALCVGDVESELSKAHVERILNGSNSSKRPTAPRRKFQGCGTFIEMSKRISQKWKSADSSTKAVFRQLSREAKDRYEKALCELFLSANMKFYNTITPSPSTTSLQEPSPTTESSRDGNNNVPAVSKCVKLEGLVSFVNKDDDDVSMKELQGFLSELDWDCLDDDDRTRLPNDLDVHEFLSEIDWNVLP